MKLLILILFLPSLLLSSDFSKISSVNFDLVGVVASGDKIAAYGTKGSVYYSDNDAQSWEVIKPFPVGNIVNFFIEGDRLIAFLQTGEVSQSYDNGLNWIVTNPIDDSVSYVIKGNDDYYIRAQSSIIKLNSDLSFSNNYLHRYDQISTIKSNYGKANNKKITFLDNKIYFSSYDRNSIMILDNNLKFLDSVNLGEKFFNSNNISIEKIESSSMNLVLLYRNNTLNSNFICKFESNFVGIKLLLNISDKNSIFGEKANQISNYYVHNEKIYTLNYNYDLNFNVRYDVFELISNDSASFIESIYPNLKYGYSYSNLSIENDRLTLVFDGNLIVSKKINSDFTQRISNLFGSSNASNLFKINDSEFILFASKNIYRSNDTTKTFKNVVGDSSVFSSYYRFSIRFNYLGSDAKKILYFAYSMNTEHTKNPPYVLISDDYGKSFLLKQLEGISIKNLANSYSILKVQNNFIVSESNASSSDIVYYIYDKNLNLIDSLLDSKYYFSNIFGQDFKNFTFLGNSIDFEDNNRYLKKTIDGGKHWSDIHTFGFTKDTIYYSSDPTQFYIAHNSDLRYSRTIENNGKSYLLFVTYNRLDSLYKVEAMDIQTNEFSLIYQNKQDTYSNILVELIDGVYFICKDDTLFTTTDLFDYNSWKGQKLPNNGTMTYKIMKSGDYLITYYYDDIHPYDIYRIKWNELTTTGISENDIEAYSYFYNSPPFPQPTSSIVTTEVYLDQGISLSKDGIKVFDMNGTQVEKGDNIEVTGTNWPTTLTWDSSNQPPGVYFIVIDYGENTRAIKVIKE